jgi:hypothetical protein
MDRRVVLLTVSIADTPTASFENRVEVRALPHGFYRVIALYVERRAERLRDLEPDRHAAARQSQHDDVVTIGVVGQRLGEAASGFNAIFETHLGWLRNLHVQRTCPLV